MKYVESLREALVRVMEHDDRVILLGEDICDPYGGAFKVTKGLSSRFSGRVTNTPISESAIVGIGTGLAIEGFLPIVEIMFGDFTTLCVDQLLNSACKFPLMYRGRVKVPLVIRTPMGGGRGYGPTHSQSLEKLFFGMPGLKVVSPSITHDPGKLLEQCVLRESEPVLFIEHKELYPKNLAASGPDISISEMDTYEGYPATIVKNYSMENRPDVVLISYGGTSLPLLDLAKDLVEEEINCKIIFLSLLNRPLKSEMVEEIKEADAIILCEEGTENFNWGSELLCQLLEAGVFKGTRKAMRLSSKGTVIPAEKAGEQNVLINKVKITQAIYESLS